MTPALGTPCRFTHSLHRRSDWQKGRVKFWKALPVLHLAFGAGHLDGIVVGVRTLADGEFRNVPWGGPFDAPEDAFVSTRHFTAYLVAYDVRRKPVYVLPEHCTLPELADPQAEAERLRAENTALRRGQGRALDAQPAGPVAVPFHQAHPIPDSTRTTTKEG